MSWFMSLVQHPTLVAFFRSANYERQILTHNRWDFSLVFWIPLLVIFLVWWVFSRSQIVDLPIGIIDYDQGRIASTLVQYLDASPDLEVAARFTSPAEAEKAIVERKVYGVVIIPHDFNQNIMSAKPAPVVLQVNAQFGTHSGIIQKGVQSVVGTVSAGTEMQRLVKQGTALSQVSATYSPITIQRVSLFNASTDYQLFLASTVLPALLHILAMIIGATTVGRELRDHKLDIWYKYIAQITDTLPSYFLTVQPTPDDLETHDLEAHLEALLDTSAPSNQDALAKDALDIKDTPLATTIKDEAITSSSLSALIAGLNGKLIWPMLAFALWAAVSLTLAYRINPVSLSAWILTYICLLLLMMVSFWLGAIITLATFSLRIGLSATGFISAPSFAFAGVTFPYIAINDSAKYWTDTLPLTHYLKLHIAQLQMGAPIAFSIPIIYGFIIATFILLLLTALLTKRALKRPDRWGAR